MTDPDPFDLNSLRASLHLPDSAWLQAGDLLSPTQIASWLDVRPSAVSNWQSSPDWPSAAGRRRIGEMRFNLCNLRARIGQGKTVVKGKMGNFGKK